MANVGKQGERLFKEIMIGRGYKVEDVSGNPEYWEKDIDFIVTSPTSGEVKTFEVKYDQCINRTGNLYLEIANVHSKGQQGWFQFCQADYVAYGDAVAQTFYIISMADLREKVKQLPTRTAQCGFDSVGRLVSLDDIADITYEL